MTVNDIIALVDLKETNAYTAEEKIRWLSDLDGKIFREVILTHEHEEGPEERAPYSDGTEALLIGAPWGDDIYVHYLIARIAAGNAEVPRYNQQIAMYNAAYLQWWNAYNASVKPLHEGRRFVF